MVEAHINRIHRIADNNKETDHSPQMHQTVPLLMITISTIPEDSQTSTKWGMTMTMMITTRTVPRPRLQRSSAPLLFGVKSPAGTFVSPPTPAKMVSQRQFMTSFPPQLSQIRLFESFLTTKPRSESFTHLHLCPPLLRHQLHTLPIEAVDQFASLLLSLFPLCLRTLSHSECSMIEPSLNLFHQ